MSYAGYNITASSGAPMPPSINELDDTAARENMQIRLGIRPGLDTLETNFTEINPEKLWKYKSNEPQLPKPHVHQMRVNTQPAEQPLVSTFEEELNSLIQEIPEEVRALLLDQVNLPPSKQNGALLAGHAVLTDIAKVLTALKQMPKEFAATSIQNALNQLNSALPEYVESSLFQSSNQALEAIGTGIEEMGRNDPSFDVLSAQVRQLSALIGLMKQLKNGHEEA